MQVIAQSHAVSVWSGAFWKAYWITMRPYLLFVSGSAGLVGTALAGSTGWVRVVMAFVPLFLSYGFGQALTDCFQTDTDSISSSYRPLCRGIVNRTQIAMVSLVGLTSACAVLAWLNPATMIIGVASVIGLATYTPFKRTWWGGPPWNSWIVALLPLMGMLAVSGLSFGELFHGSRALTLLLAMTAVFFGYANFVVMGYLKDISADRVTGYHTFPVVFGWKAAARYSDLTALGAAAFTAAMMITSGSVSVAAMIIFSAGLVVNLLSQIQIHRTRQEQESHGPIAGVVRAFVFYCLAMVACLRPGWLIGCLCFYVLFEITLRLRPERTQV
jgi:4-hydroxybenzoate polyprenyltransferase